MQGEIKYGRTGLSSCVRWPVFLFLASLASWRSFILPGIQAEGMNAGAPSAEEERKAGSKPIPIRPIRTLLPPRLCVSAFIPTFLPWRPWPACCTSDETCGRSFEENDGVWRRGTPAFSNIVRRPWLLGLRRINLCRAEA